MGYKQETKFLNLFFNFLENEQIEYIVMKNYETLPETVSGTDIDILIDSKDYELCRTKLKNEVRRIDYKQWKEYPKNFDIIQMSFVPEVCRNSQDVVRIDFVMDNMKWLGFDLINSAFLWKNRRKKNGIWVLGNPAKNALTLLNTFLYGGKIKNKYLLEYRSLETQNREIVDKCILDSFGDYGEKIIEKLQKGKIEEIKNFNARKIKFNFLKSRGFYLKVILKGCWSWLRTGFQRAIHPPGLFIALIGPDGCGKSTLREILRKKCKRIFPGIDHFHLFPKLRIFGFLDRMSHVRWEKRKNRYPEWEQRNKKYSTGISLLRCFNLLARFWIGYSFWIYPRLVKGHLIIGERWCYDILFDPASKGIGLPHWFRKIVFYLCPSPQKPIVLSGEAGKIAKRKEELPKEEIERQIKMIENEFIRNSNVGFVNSAESLDNTFREILRSLCL